MDDWTQADPELIAELDKAAAVMADAPAPLPAVTRGDVAAALYRSHVAADLGLRTESCNRLADAVMALLAEAPQPKVLWAGETVVTQDSQLSLVDIVLFRPSGTRVLVVEALASPAPEEPTDEGACICGPRGDGSDPDDDGPDPQCPQHAPEPDGSCPR